MYVFFCLEFLHRHQQKWRPLKFLRQQQNWLYYIDSASEKSKNIFKKSLIFMPQNFLWNHAVFVTKKCPYESTKYIYKG